MKDWTGNANSIYKTLGASNHTDKRREENDYYATEPRAAELLLGVEEFCKDQVIWECACGEGHLAKVFDKAGYKVCASDLVNRGYGVHGIDFLTYTDTCKANIVTNPPYKYAKEFCEHALDIVADGYMVAMFLKLQFLEGKARKNYLKNIHQNVYTFRVAACFAQRTVSLKKMKAGGGSAVAYAWFVWQKGYTGETVIKWIN